MEKILKQGIIYILPFNYLLFLLNVSYLFLLYTTLLYKSHLAEETVFPPIVADELFFLHTLKHFSPPQKGKCKYFLRNHFIPLRNVI